MGGNAVKYLISEKEENSLNFKSEVIIPFSVRLSERDMKRLEYIASRYDTKRAEMARELLVAALSDAEEVIGLSFDLDNPLSVLYQDYLYGRITLEEFNAKQGTADKDGDQ